MTDKTTQGAAEMPEFTEKFDNHVCDGEQISMEWQGFLIIATVYRDDNETPPWKQEDGHGPVSEWTGRAKRPGERVLNTDHGSKRYYDFAEAVEIAKRDGWGPPIEGASKAEIAAAAAERDFAALKAWCNDEWHYVGIAVRVQREGIWLTGEYDHALWGIEANFPGSDNAYLTEVANDHVGEAVKAAQAKLATLCGRACA